MGMHAISYLVFDFSLRHVLSHIIFWGVLLSRALYFFLFDFIVCFISFVLILFLSFFLFFPFPPFLCLILYGVIDE